MNILLIEDDMELAEILTEYLRQQGFNVTHLSDGKTATITILNHPWDLVLLNIKLPGMDGIGICQEVRQCSQVPIIMLTASVAEIHRLLSLEIEADDFVCKPYSPRDVVARIKAALRKTVSWTPYPEDLRELSLDEGTLTAKFNGSDIDLTLAEWQILEALLYQNRRIFSRDQLMCHLYRNPQIVHDQTIDSHISKLRRKLASLIGDDPIRSVYGAGYKLDMPELP
ncbi:hypothetical protein BTA51_01550 [Hahella sp. CCB-MM4]|uniref:response regulator n=1 Tax=Hahella sp. (strain CCB-MM4) TaxID=1926491 RepID=UPI000B9A3F8E|nr:response regulator [Hahella sp. CCB-MM4]OZG75102.1 hypothetical protein BTA51_01550 [Hahella sp. CCB-MM4]